MANLLSTGIYGFLCSLEKKSGKYISSFVSKVSGWIIKSNGDAEFKSIYVRDKITTNEFVYNRIRVTEDEEIITSNGKIANLTYNGNDVFTVFLDLREGDINPFMKDDLLMGYYHNPENSGVIYSVQKFTVKDFPNTEDQSMILSRERGSDYYPYIHMILVRVGNSNSKNVDRQSFVKISSRTNAQYFYDDIKSWAALDNPENIKCFLGKISTDTISLVPDWAKSAVGTLRKFFLIADGVILRGSFVLKSNKTIEEEIENTKVGGKNLMRRSSCISKDPIHFSIVDTKRPMAVNTDVYGTHRLNDGFAQIGGEGDYYWYVWPVNEGAGLPGDTSSAMYNLWGGFTSSYQELGNKNFVAEYNDYYTLSFDYYFEGVVGEIPLAARFYWGTTYPGTEDVTETVYELLNKTPGVWHHCELTVDLRKYKASIFESKKNIFFQVRTVSGWGQNYAGWKMFHRNIQLEKGYSATGWVPALVDSAYALTELETRFEIKEGQISSSVKEARTYSDNAINAANAASDSAKNAGNSFSNIKVLESSIIQESGKISSKVSEMDGLVDQAKGTLTEISNKETSINQTAGEINSKATEVQKNANIASTKASEASQTASGFQTTVSEETKKAVDSAVAGADAAITQKVSTQVSQSAREWKVEVFGENNEKVISSINASPEGIQIEGKKVKISGELLAQIINASGLNIGNGNLVIDENGNISLTGSFSTSSFGKRIIIENKTDRTGIRLINEKGYTVGTINFISGSFGSVGFMQFFEINSSGVAINEIRYSPSNIYMISRNGINENTMALSADGINFFKDGTRIKGI